MSVLVPALQARRTIAPSIPPAPATLDRVTGHIATCAGVVATRLGCHATGGDPRRRSAATPANLVRLRRQRDGTCAPPEMPPLYPHMRHPRRVTRTSTTARAARHVSPRPGCMPAISDPASRVAPVVCPGLDFVQKNFGGHHHWTDRQTDARFLRTPTRGSSALPTRNTLFKLDKVWTSVLSETTSVREPRNFSFSS